MLSTVITKREQFHSNIIGQWVTVGRPEVHDRLDALTRYFMAHGVTDPVVAARKAAIAIGTVVKREPLVMAFSDTFAVVEFALVVAAIAILLTRKVANVAGVAAH